jgi:hypothetical protein
MSVAVSYFMSWDECSASVETHHSEDLVFLQTRPSAYPKRLERVDLLYYPHFALLPVQHVFLGALLLPRCNIVFVVRRRRDKVVACGELGVAAEHFGVLIFDAFRDIGVWGPCPANTISPQFFSVYSQWWGQDISENNCVNT